MSNESNLVVKYNSNIYDLMWITFFLGFSLCQIANVTFGLQGLKMGGVTFNYSLSLYYAKHVTMRAVAIVVVHQGICQALTYADMDLEYYLISFVLLPVFLALQIFLDSVKHNNALVMDGLLAGKKEENEFEKKRNARRTRLTKSAKGFKTLQNVEKRTGVRIKVAHLVLSFISMIGYPIFFIAPHYSSLDLIPKLFVVLVFHPILTEIVVGFFRFKNANDDDIRRSLHQARKHSLIFFVESNLYLLKWVMILQLGKFEDICIGAMASSLIGIISRVSLNRRQIHPLQDIKARFS